MNRFERGDIVTIGPVRFFVYSRDTVRLLVFPLVPGKKPADRGHVAVEAEEDIKACGMTVSFYVDITSYRRRLTRYASRAGAASSGTIIRVTEELGNLIEWMEQRV